MSEATVTCKNGHTYSIEDLDELGMDRVCPECFTKIANEEIEEARRERYGEN